MRRLVLSAILVLLATVASAQTVPGPRVSLAFDRPMSPTCEQPTGSADAMTFTYGTCYLPTGVTLGSPFITNVRVTFSGATTSSVLVPRGQVILESNATRCAPGPAPCYRINDLPAPVGPSNVTLQFVDAESRSGGASTAIPFSGSQPPVPALTGARTPTVP